MGTLLFDQSSTATAYAWVDAPIEPDTWMIEEFGLILPGDAIYIYRKGNVEPIKLLYASGEPADSKDPWASMLRLRGMKKGIETVMKRFYLGDNIERVCIDDTRPTIQGMLKSGKTSPEAVELLSAVSLFVYEVALDLGKIPVNRLNNMQYKAHVAHGKATKKEMIAAAKKIVDGDGFPDFGQSDDIADVICMSEFTINKFLLS